jgi:hypothetical protein
LVVVALQSGHVFFADDLGHCTEVVNVGISLTALYYSHSKVGQRAACGVHVAVLPVLGAHWLCCLLPAPARLAQDYLLLVSSDVVLYKYRISPEGRMAQEKKVCVCCLAFPLHHLVDSLGCAGQAEHQRRWLGAAVHLGR